MAERTNGTRTIGALAREVGVGVETVRYYQRRGLLPEPPRPTAGARPGVRRYDADALRRLRFIRRAGAAGFTLDEVAQLLALDAGADRPAAFALARTRLAALDARIAELQSARAALFRLADACGGEGEGECPILAAFE